MECDVWFARYEDSLWAVTTRPGQAPTHEPHEVLSAAGTLRRIRERGHTITQVGICDPEMIGLDVEL